MKKKLLVSLLCLVYATTSSLGFIACDNDNKGNNASNNISNNLPNDTEDDASDTVDGNSSDNSDTNQQTEEYVDGVKYVLSEDGTYYSLVNMDSYEGSEFVVPDTCNDLPVKAIAYGAFGESKLTKVVISDNVTEIGEFAFAKCTHLTDVVMGNGVSSIGKAAFWNCNALTNVVIGNSVTHIGESAFKECENLRIITLPDGVGIPNLHPLKNNGVL